VKLEFETNESRHVDFLNQDCALAPDLESMLRRDSCKLLFRQHRPTADSQLFYVGGGVLNFVTYKGILEVHNSLLNVALHNNPHVRRRSGKAD
jgi:hypothetical protein